MECISMGRKMLELVSLFGECGGGGGETFIVVV